MLQTYQRQLRASIILLLCLLNLSIGYCGGNTPLAGGGAAGMCYVLLLTTQAHDLARRGNGSRLAVLDIAPSTPQLAADRASFDDPVEKMLGQFRYARLLRREIADNLSEKDFQRVVGALQQGMAFVPEGSVAVNVGEEFLSDDVNGDAAGRSVPGCLIHVGPFLLDRYPITNRQYYEFVAAGGYRELALWEASIWPAVLDMVDQTGLPGPRFWRDGCYLPGEEESPVVGIGWYEAAVCAGWLGKRLPTDAEWVKAASWPIPIDAKTLAQRRYPWGDAMDRTRANVWGSGPNRIVAVREFAEGVTVGGIYQLIGNIWEWTNGDFHDGPGDAKLELPTPMKSIRGGAFDTYFESQASAQFQSGENPLSRRHNIGFRCALGLRDVVLDRTSSRAPATCLDRAAEGRKETAT